MPLSLKKKLATVLAFLKGKVSSIHQRITVFRHLSRKEKLAVTAFYIVWIWWANPLPEISIGIALITGGSVSLATLNWTNMQISLLMLVVTYHPVSWFMETYITPKITTLRKV